jgi:hypothetical protein
MCECVHSFRRCPPMLSCGRGASLCTQSAARLILSGEAPSARLLHLTDERADGRMDDQVRVTPLEHVGLPTSLTVGNAWTYYWALQNPLLSITLRGVVARRSQHSRWSPLPLLLHFTLSHYRTPTRSLFLPQARTAFSVRSSTFLTCDISLSVCLSVCLSG